MSYVENLCLFLILFFFCDKFEMADELYNRLAYLMAGMKNIVSQSKYIPGGGGGQQ